MSADDNEYVRSFMLSGLAAQRAADEITRDLRAPRPSAELARLVLELGAMPIDVLKFAMGRLAPDDATTDAQQPALSLLAILIAQAAIEHESRGAKTVCALCWSPVCTCFVGAPTDPPPAATLRGCSACGTVLRDARDGSAWCDGCAARVRCEP